MSSRRTATTGAIIRLRIMTYKLALPLLALLCVSSVFAQHKDFELPTMHAARGTRGALASGSEYADEAGMRMYYHGGNAVDAGVAKMFAASVAEFSHFGMGGEAPILIRTKAGKVYAIAGVGPMPKLATAKFFLEHRPRPGEILTLDPGGLKGIIPVAGIMPALVPSMVEAGLVALRDFGTKSFSEEVEPAIELADGIAIDETRAGTIARSRRFFDLWPDSKKASSPKAGFPCLARFSTSPTWRARLRAMAAAEKKALAGGASRAAAIDAVRDYFYRGDIAHRIDAFMQANGGLLRYEDMAAFKLEPEEPVSPITTRLQSLQARILEPGAGDDRSAEYSGRLRFAHRIGYNSAEYIHRVMEALKLAYADRDTYYGDPKFNHIPAEMLLSKDLCRRTAQTDRTQRFAWIFSRHHQR